MARIGLPGITQYGKPMLMGPFLILVFALGCSAEKMPDVDDSPLYDVKKLGSTCSDNEDCTTIKHGFCEVVSGICRCMPTHPVTVENHKDICYEAKALNNSCVHDEQCEYTETHSHCILGVCRCVDGHEMKSTANGTLYCTKFKSKEAPPDEMDYTMLGVLAGMAVMFIVMCIVLRMFSRARFQEPRSIFNSPRLLKMSLARKTREQADATASRRGSRASVPSRQPSLYSGLNVPAKSPTGSHGSGDRRSTGSRRSSMQSPMADRKSFPRNSDQVIVDIKGTREKLVSKANQV